MFGKPKHNGRNQCCGQRGRCSCQRRVNAQIAARPQDAPHACGQMCGQRRGQVCGRTVRGGVCPCPNC
jgi:hypothetical protein